MSTEFKAIMVGGSVAGLKLARTPNSTGMDYALLEGRDNVAPAAGAIILMTPNGMRMLDQLRLIEMSSRAAGFIRNVEIGW